MKIIQYQPHRMSSFFEHCFEILGALSFIGVMLACLLPSGYRFMAPSAWIFVICLVGWSFIQFFVPIKPKSEEEDGNGLNS